MRIGTERSKLYCLFLCALVFLLQNRLPAQNGNFHNAPASAKALKNPYEGQSIAPGKQLYQTNCSNCHGDNGEGSGNIPSLKTSAVKAATPGELFWFVTHGSVANGMPSWANLPQKQRWQIVTYLEVLGSPASARTGGNAAPERAASANLPVPKPPFTDFRYEKPGLTRKITLSDLPAPYATQSASNGPKVVARPEGAWPQVPDGFKVEQYATGLDDPREIRTAPNGDFFVAESKTGDVRVFRGLTETGKAQLMSVFATGLKQPFGVNFYPPGPKPEWVYVGNTDSVVRFPYQDGDIVARGPAEHVVDVPAGDNHWTRDILFSREGKTMYVAVGSASNVDDQDTTPAEKNRANILAFNPDGTDMRIFARGIRNPVTMQFSPETGELWTSVNERDGLGDNLVPDYITHVEQGGFYGWPWWYMGGHQDPRHPGKHPELKDQVITPDVLLNPHNASLGIAFYEGKQFPADYMGDLFAAEHGSWNRSIRVGYEVIRVPFHQKGRASGEYEDFMTGFVVDNGHVWGRPVCVTVAQDGSLLVTDDASESIWRITFAK